MNEDPGNISDIPGSFMKLMILFVSGLYMQLSWKLL